MFKIESKSLFAEGERALSKTEFDILNFRLNDGLPTGLKILSSVEESIALVKSIYQEITAVNKVVILGTGGSSLGGQAVYALSKYINKHSVPVIEFWENIDPSEIELSLSSVDFNNTAFISISKSGETPETLAQTAIVINRFLVNGNKNILKNRFFAVTQSENSSLGKLLYEHSIRILPHPQDIGGRFSVFSIVGILPTVIAGLDACALCKGAQDVLYCLRNQSDQWQVLTASLLSVAKKFSDIESNINSRVLMHYSDGLSSFARWFAQLWAESLGKQGKGTTPIIARGTVDQHSQLQLYLDGPNDKLFTVISICNNPDDTPCVIGLPSTVNTKYLEGYSLREIFNAEREATIQALIQEGRLLQYIELSSLNERTLGQIMAYFMLEVVITADMMKINAFDQPAVEKGKLIMKELLPAKCK